MVDNLSILKGLCIVARIWREEVSRSSVSLIHGRLLDKCVKVLLVENDLRP